MSKIAWKEGDKYIYIKRMHVTTNYSAEAVIEV